MTPPEIRGAFSSREELQLPVEGEGITRPTKGAETKKFRLLVKQRSIPQLKIVLHAETPEDALRYAHARWPESIIDVIQ